MTDETDIRSDNKEYSGDGKRGEGDKALKEHGEGDRSDTIGEDTVDLGEDGTEETNKKAPEDASEDGKGPMTTENTKEDSKDGKNKDEEKGNNFKYNDNAEADD